MKVFGKQLALKLSLISLTVFVMGGSKIGAVGLVEGSSKNPLHKRIFTKTMVTNLDKLQNVIKPGNREVMQTSLIPTDELTGIPAEAIQSILIESDLSSIPEPNEALTTPEPIDQQAAFVELPMGDDYHSQLNETSSPNACGPASLLMILDYYGLEDSLDLLIASQSLSPLQGGYDPYCTINVVCMSPGALAQIASQDHGLSVDVHEGWTFAEVYDALANGQPIIADIAWRLKEQGPGHFVVIYGIDSVSQVIYYHDPYDGSGMVATWAEFAEAWDGPIDIGDPLQPEGHRFWGMAVYQAD